VNLGVVSTELDQVVEEIRSAERFLLTTHENPDGDALGSLLAMHHILEGLGKDSVMFLAAKEFPLPIEYRFLPLEEVFHEPPADLVDRTRIFLDCGNIERMPVDFLQTDDAHVLNIDHHHDNTRFGTVHLVDVEASSTAEIIYGIARQLEAEITPTVATALYVGLVTDTGRFMYENTRPRAHQIAAELIEAGVDVHDIYRRLYERVPLEKLNLVCKALTKVELVEDGALAISYLSAEDFRDANASEALTEGIIDQVRSIEGAQVAALVRDQVGGGPEARKVSLRSTNGKVDVSSIARQHGGGGHRRAAGFSTDLGYPELVELLRAEVAAQL
jgi:bifunctional oligoribonuclease and PAP phosphatase NrnA